MLQDAYDVLRAMLHAVDGGGLIVDSAGRIRWVNRTAADVLGASEAKLTGRKVHDVLHGFPDGIEPSTGTCPACRLLFDGQTRRGVEDVFRRFDRTPFPARYNVVRLRPGGEASDDAAWIILTFQDVSEQRRMEEELRRLRAVIEEIPALISMCDVKGGVTFFNKTGRQWLGLGEGERMQPRPRVASPEGARMTRLAAKRGVYQSERQRFLKGLVPKEQERTVFQTVMAHKNAAGQVDFYSTIALDITEQKRLEEHSRRLLAIIEDTPDFVATADARGNVLYYNKAARAMLGLRDDEDITSITIAETHPEWAARLVLEEGLPTAAREGVWEAETAFLSRSGEEIPVSQVILAHKNSRGEIDYFSTIARNMSERKRVEERLTYLANHDPLTGVINRTRFQQELQQRLDDARRSGSGGALLYLDLDNFKFINDNWGHQTGDDVLKEIARLLQRHLRAQDVVARLGGDEFAVILPGLAGPQARRLGHRLLKAIEDELPRALPKPIPIAASIGVATYPEDAATVKDLLINADLSMYDAKRAGGGRVALFANPTRFTPSTDHIRKR